MRVLLGIAGVVDDLGIGGTVVGYFTCQRAVFVVFVGDRIACIAPGRGAQVAVLYLGAGKRQEAFRAGEDDKGHEQAYKPLNSETAGPAFRPDAEP